MHEHRRVGQPSRSVGGASNGRPAGLATGRQAVPQVDLQAAPGARADETARTARASSCRKAHRGLDRRTSIRRLRLPSRRNPADGGQRREEVGASGMSSNPTTLISSGTSARPRAAPAAGRAPSGRWRRTPQHAVGGQPPAQVVAARGLQSPTSGSGTSAPARVERRPPAVGARSAREVRGPVMCHTVRWPRSSRCRVARRRPRPDRRPPLGAVGPAPPRRPRAARPGLQQRIAGLASAR